MWLLARRMGLNNTCVHQRVTADSVLLWIEKAGNHAEEFTDFMMHDMQLDEVQIDEFWSFIQKKENLTPLEQKKQETNSECAKNKGDRWTFTAVLPRSGFVHTVHTAKRNSEEAMVFLEKMKRRSNKLAPLFLLIQTTNLFFRRY